MLGSAERRMVRLIRREIISEEFQRMITVHQRYVDRRTDRHTDRQTTYHGKYRAALRFAR